jgi:hypothetical protein
MREPDAIMGSDFGCKATSGLCQSIITLMLPHDIYIEIHIEGGAIMQRKPPARRTIAIDVALVPLARFECHYPVGKVHGCAHRFLREFAFHGREPLYCEPPYLHQTRRCARRYRFDYEAQDHVALLELIESLPCSVSLSGYPSALYDGKRPCASCSKTDGPRLWAWPLSSYSLLRLFVTARCGQCDGRFAPCVRERQLRI